jgi:hypothetical protein
MTERTNAMTLDRFEQLLDAYGAAPARWPDAERSSAEELLARSVVARERWQAAADLDRLLDALRAAAPSAELATSVLAGARRLPAPRRVVRFALGAAMPLAAAAALVLWITGTEQRHLIGTDKLTTIALGEYTSPTDALLRSYTVETATPVVGCDDSTLACPSFKSTTRGRPPVGAREEVQS